MNTDGTGGAEAFAYLRQADFAAFEKLGPGERLSQKLLNRATGADKVAVSMIHTPPGGGSPEGLHTHDFEQVFYVLSGVMRIEAGGSTFDAPAGSLVVFPQGEAHRNWNEGTEPTVHLAISVPAPPPGVPAAKPVR